MLMQNIVLLWVASGIWGLVSVIALGAERTFLFIYTPMLVSGVLGGLGLALTIIYSVYMWRKY